MYSHHYNFYGNTLKISVSDKSLLRFIHNRFVAFSSKQEPFNPDIFVTIKKVNPEDIPKNRQFYCNKLLIVSTGKRSATICNYFNKPWRIHIQYIQEERAGSKDKKMDRLSQTYYYLLEPILLSILKRAGLFHMHGAAVERKGNGILILAKGKSGKSTTTLNLIKNGFSFISDDQILIKKTGEKVSMLSFKEKSMFLTKAALRFFPELSFLNKTADIKKGHQFKKEIQIRNHLNSSILHESKIRVIIFPHITPREDTKIIPVSKPKCMLLLLSQLPREGRSFFKDTECLRKQFAVYSRLSKTTNAYSLSIGKHTENISKLISNLIK